MSIEFYHAEPADSPESPSMPGISPTPSSPRITLMPMNQVLSQSTSNRNYASSMPSILVAATQLKLSRVFHSNVTHSLQDLWKSSLLSVLQSMSRCSGWDAYTCAHSQGTTNHVMTTLKDISNFIYFLPFLFSLYQWLEHSRTPYNSPYFFNMTYVLVQSNMT